MHKRTKALSIPGSVKQAVWKRDGGCCILCGSIHASPNAHFISRAQGGLGIEENIITLCYVCHRMYDQSHYRAEIREDIAEYLRGQYPNWNEADLVYKKGK